MAAAATNLQQQPPINHSSNTGYSGIVVCMAAAATNLQQQQPQNNHSSNHQPYWDCGTVTLLSPRVKTTSCTLQYHNPNMQS